MDLHEEAKLPKLLCIDDDPTVLASVGRLLGKDFQVLLAENSVEAMVLLDENKDVAVVLSDHRLQETTGLELLSRVQTKAPTAVRAIFSAAMDLQDMVTAINTQRIHRFILKPWDNEYFRVQMLEALANHSTLREKNQLEELSVTDSVTGLKNHRYFQDRLRIEAERSLRHYRPLSLAMIDIDNFKSLNDRFGHPVGDQVLRALAVRLQDQVRTLDTVARYGGEEFAILMPDTSFDDAFKVAERIRLTISRNEFNFPQVLAIKTTTSIGVACIPDHATSPQDLVSAADKALYQAKGLGKNQTIGAGLPTKLS